MTLKLNIDHSLGPGRRALPVSFEVAREVGESDLHLVATQDVGSTPSPLQRITDRHHQLARLLASGTPESEASLICGYDPSRISNLKKSPAFQELLALYRKGAEQKWASTVERMAGVARDALEELSSRLEENPAKFTNMELAKITTELSDRTVGHDNGVEDAGLPTVIELVAGPSPANERTSLPEAGDGEGD